MSLWRMILINLRRHRVRTLTGTAVMALGVAMMLSLVGVSGGVRGMSGPIPGNGVGTVVAEEEGGIFSNHPGRIALENQEFSRDHSHAGLPGTMAWIVGGCAFLVGCLGITSTMILAVFGRTKELAIARVCGFSRGQLFVMVLGESFLVSMLGLLTGWAVSGVCLDFLRTFPQLQGRVEPGVGWVEIAGAMGLAAFASFCGAIYPACHAAGLNPARALRYD